MNWKKFLLALLSQRKATATTLLAVLMLMIAVDAKIAFASAPTLKAPWNDGDYWQPSTYEGHAGLGTRSSLDFNVVSSVRGSWPFGTEGSDLGREIRAAHSGTVSQLNSNGYGKYVKIKYNQDAAYETLYAHLNAFVGSNGRVVNQGDIIGYCGTTGYSTAPHLHFELRKSGSYQNIDTLSFSGQSVSIDYGRLDSIGRNLGRPIQGRAVGGGTSDTTAPIGHLDAPNSDVAVNGVFHINGWAYDAGQGATGIRDVQVLLDSNVLSGITYGGSRPDVGGNYGFGGDWDTRSVGNGQHTIQLRVVDNAGNVNNVDNTADFKRVVTVLNSRRIGEREDHSIDQRFVDCFNRTESVYGAGYVGKPTDHGGGLYAHTAASGLLQDVDGGSGGRGYLLAKNGAALAYDVQGEFAQKWNDMGNYGGVLGWPAGDRIGAASPQGYGGAGQRFEDGNIYSRVVPNSVEVHAVLGPMRDKYQEFGGPGSAVGFPISEKITVAPDHYIQNFEGGTLYAYSKGMFFVIGNVKRSYDANGGASGFWGLPIDDNKPLTAKTRQGGAGFLQYFENGHCYNSPFGAFLVRDPIRPVYQSLGWEAGALGYPTSPDVDIDSAAGTTGWVQTFEGGNIYYSKFGIYPVLNGPVRDRFAAQQYENGNLGFPVSSPYSYLGGTRQDFEGGSITVGASISIKLTSATVVGGTNAAGTVTLSGAAPTGGVRVNIASSNRTVVGSSSLVVAAGQTSAKFSLATVKVTKAVGVTITATTGDLKASAPLQIVVPPVSKNVPSIVSVLHSNRAPSASSPVEQARAITSTVRDSDGANTLSNTAIWIGSTAKGAPFLYGFYDTKRNLFYLRSDDNKRWLGGVAPGTKTVISNKWGRLNMAATGFRRSGQTLIVTWNFSPSLGMLGMQPTSAQVVDETNLRDGWKKTGNWTITSSPSREHSLEDDEPSAPSARSS